MSKYEEGLKLIEEKFGGGRDNTIALATIATQPSGSGRPCPAVREVDAYYEDCTFYVTTHGQSSKMLQIAQNPEVAISIDWFTAAGTAENLGWVLDPKNAELRAKLRKAFTGWYDLANNEQDENCCILAIRLTKGTLNINHWEQMYYMDFISKSCK